MAGITAGEQFDPNDQNEVKIPMEFRRYPVDELTDIHVKYKDEYYDRFIETAEEIFYKYNEEMRCNPDNDLLYYETDECDSKLNIEHGHGGYLCNEDGEWDKETCVLKYCDVGYILDIENNNFSWFFSFIISNIFSSFFFHELFRINTIKFNFFCSVMNSITIII